MDIILQQGLKIIDDLPKVFKLETVGDDERNSAVLVTGLVLQQVRAEWLY